MFVERNSAKVERFKHYFESIREALRGYDIEVTPGEIFDSGYQGFTFFIKGLKCIVIEQKGVTGLEDHREGYVEVIVNQKRKIIIRHRSRHFGDTHLNEQEIAWVEENLWEEVMDLLVLNGIAI